MKKLYRIRKNEEFSRIIKERHSIANAGFVVYYSPSRMENARVGISVSKKLGDAVTRNLIKRQVREMARALIDFENYKKDFIIIIRSSFLNKNYQENLLDLEKILKKAIIE